MPYVPPHRRRHSRDGHLPTPSSLAPLFNRNLSLSSSNSNRHAARAIVYADSAVHEWFPVGLSPPQNILSSVTLRPISVHAVRGRSSLVLLPLGPSEEAIAGDPWRLITELVLPHLVSSFRALRSIGENENDLIIRPDLVARFGKILFHGSSTVTAEDAHTCVSESSLRKSRRTFYTNVPYAYTKEVTDAVAPKIGAELEDEKDVYHVKLHDKLRPDVALSCKCRLVKEEQKLEVYKVELTVLRQMVVDLSCIHKDLDLRLMLSAKRTMKALSEEELTAIADLIGSATVDPDVMGGLRWPLGKTSSTCTRYDVIGAWHITSKCYSSTSYKLKVRQAARFDFLRSIGQATSEVTLKMREITRVLWDQNPEDDMISEMLWKSLELIWEHFLQSKYPVLEEAAPA